MRGINNLGDVSGTYSIVDLNADEFGFILMPMRYRTTQGHARQRKVERAMGIEPTGNALPSL
jgi:hypothetical protein